MYYIEKGVLCAIAPLEVVTSSLAVDIQQLSATIGKKLILQGISFSIPSGKLCSILGPNGAGKTTLIKTLIGGVALSSGTARVYGLDVARDLLRIKHMIGITPQENNLYEALSAEENLHLHGRLFGMSTRQIRARTTEVLHLVELSERGKDPVRKFSGGMKRRLVIARSIFHNPAVVFLDEPTTGLDPEARRAVWKMLQNLKQEHVSLLLTTHYMEEAEQLSDHVVVLNSGQIIAEGTPQELLQAHVGMAFVELAGLSSEGLARLQELYPHLQTVENGQARIPTDQLAKIPAIIRDLETHNISFSTILTRQSTLEDVFFKLTGRKIIES